MSERRYGKERERNVGEEYIKRVKHKKIINKISGEGKSLLRVVYFRIVRRKVSVLHVLIAAWGVTSCVCVCCMREIAVENLKCVSIKGAKKNIEFSPHFIKERLKTFQLFIFPSIFNPPVFLTPPPYRRTWKISSPRKLQNWYLRRKQNSPPSSEVSYSLEEMKNTLLPR